MTATVEAPSRLRSAAAVASPSPTRPTELSNRFVLTGVSWQSYEEMLAFRDRLGRRFRLGFDRGELEIMSTSHLHEAFGQWLSLLIQVYVLFERIPSAGRGAMTLRRASLQRGVDPDKCYWFASEAAVRNPSGVEWDSHPPPDLVVEIEVSRSVLDRLGIYAAMGVPEVWRCDGTTLSVLRLSPQTGQYVPSSESAALAGFPISAVPTFLARFASEGETAVQTAFADWLRAGCPALPPSPPSVSPSSPNSEAAP